MACSSASFSQSAFSEAAFASASAAAPYPLIGREAPDFALHALVGSNVRLSEALGDVVVVTRAIEQAEAGVEMKMNEVRHMIAAAERRENVAPGASPGFLYVERVRTGGAKDFEDSFVPTGLEVQDDAYPGLAPGATLCRRSVAE